MFPWTALSPTLGQRRHAASSPPRAALRSCRGAFPRRGLPHQSSCPRRPLGHFGPRCRAPFPRWERPAVSSLLASVEAPAAPSPARGAELAPPASARVVEPLRAVAEGRRAARSRPAAEVVVSVAARLEAARAVGLLAVGVRVEAPRAPREPARDPWIRSSDVSSPTSAPSFPTPAQSGAAPRRRGRHSTYRWTGVVPRRHSCPAPRGVTFPVL